MREREVPAKHVPGMIMKLDIRDARETHVRGGFSAGASWIGGHGFLELLALL